jgi:hypothetical protein
MVGRPAGRNLFGFLRVPLWPSSIIVQLKLQKEATFFLFEGLACTSRAGELHHHHHCHFPKLRPLPLPLPLVLLLPLPPLTIQSHRRRSLLHLITRPAPAAPTLSHSSRLSFNFFTQPPSSHHPPSVLVSPFLFLPLLLPPPSWRPSEQLSSRR